MADEMTTEHKLLLRISRAQYDRSKGILDVRGWCLCGEGVPELTLLAHDTPIAKGQFKVNLPRHDILERYPEYKRGDSGWHVRAKVDLPPDLTDICVLARTDTERERAYRPIESYESDPFMRLVPTAEAPPLKALAFADVRGIYPLQSYVPRFGNNVVNCFDVDAWRDATELKVLGLRLVVRSGRVSMALRNVTRDGQVTELARLEQDGPGTRICPAMRLEDFTGALVPVVMEASEGANYEIIFCTDDQPVTPHARINYVFCTFKRPEYVQHNAGVFQDYLRRHRAQDFAHLTVIDNGADTREACGVAPGDHVTVLDNNNTGGAGGFGRGIYETCYGSLTSRNFTHVCLLDDDIYLDPEMFARNGALVRFLKPGYHIGAPMYPTSSPNLAPKTAACFGHKFRGSTHPSDRAIGGGLDTSDVQGFIRMDREPDSTGWWWDCIAVADVHRIGLPYPFFIKMDDVEYGLRLRDAGVKLVIPYSFWVLHDDFDEKYSAAMQYFRFRNRWLLLAQKGLIDDVDLFIRNYDKLVRDFVAERKYEHAQLLLDAMEHFLRGPDYLIKHEKAILKGIFAVVKHEKNVEMHEPPLGSEIMNGLEEPASERTQWLNRVTVNNHFVPLKEDVVIDLNRPHKATDTRRARKVSYWNPAKGVGYTVERNSMRALVQMSRLSSLRRQMRRLPKIIKSYQNAKGHLTSQAFWATYGHFGAEPQIGPAAVEPAAVRDLRNEVSRLHIALQERGAIDAHRARDVSPEDEAFLNATRNRYLGQRCFVLGNGPSLRVSDLELLRDEVTFAANKIYLCFDETNWRPTYYSVEDLLVARNNMAEIMSVEGTTKIFPHHMLPLLPRRPNHHYARWLPPADNRSPHREFSTDLAKGICWGSTITYSLMQMAVHMGFREIYILGLDHSYVEPDTKKDGALVSQGEVNHFHPDYRKTGEVWHLPVLDRLETSYGFAKTYCDSIGVKVYNASRYSKLDVFPRVDLDTVLGRAQVPENKEKVHGNV